MAVNPLGTSGSSIDTNAIVQQLMQVEMQPLLKLKQKEAGYQAKVSAYATLLSSVSSLKSAVGGLKDITMGKSASSSDTTFFTATATSSAASGAHTININNIATAQSIYSSTFASESSEVADLSTYTTQKLRLKVGSTTTDISITSSNNTLSGIRDAINNAKAGVTASTLDSGFVVTASNKTIKFTEGVSTYTVNLTEGTYTASALSAEIKRAIEAGNGANAYTVSYDTTSKKFTIQSDAANADNVDFLWEDAVTTAEGLLGFTATDHAAVSPGNSTVSDNTVGTYRLILTSNSTGVANRIIVQVDEDNDGTFEESGAEQDTTGLSKLAFNATYNADGTTSGGITNMTQTQAAVDAKLKIDNLEVTRSSNTISDVITGVTITLLKGDSANYATSAGNKTLTISDDTSSLTSKISSFVSAYNAVMSTITGLKGNTAQRGILSGDSTLTTLSGLLRSVTTTKYRDSATDNTLSYLGITHDKKGVMSLDSSKLSSAISASSSAVTSMLDEMATSMETSLNSYVNTIIPARKSGYQETVKNIQKSEENLDRRLQLEEVALKKKFIALDRLLNQLQGTSSYLTQQMDMLGKTFGGKK
jgi:flagellar hook-associated protein 2